VAKRSGGGTAVLGKGLRVRGRVRGDGDLRVEADVEGDVVVSGRLELAEGATVTGSVQATSLVVEGTLDGDLAVEGSVAIAASGRVSGDVKAAEFTLDEGASFVGQVDADFDLPDAIA
jgi:cytoskeletal protein CcmA (bactofilin family)